jgi:hypothetical protein
VLDLRSARSTRVAVGRPLGVLCLVLVVTACTPDLEPSSDAIGGSDSSIEVDDDGLSWGDCGPDPAPDFDDHTVHHFASADAFFDFADTEGIPQLVKFALTDFSDVGGPSYFMAPMFYSLHDEWYWFRLLNGAPIPCLDIASEPFSFESIEAVYEAYMPLREGLQDALPLDLRFTADGRLYSPEFYRLGLFDEPRFFGLGTLLYYPAEPKRVVPESLWLFELEYGDEATAEQVLRFYERVKDALPTDVAEELRWLARSDLQEERGAEMTADGGPLAGKVLSYADLVVAGTVVSYNDGIVAGRIKRIHKGEIGAATLGPRDIVVLEEVPDYLPPVAAIVTAVPQTPLAHLNLLAKSRGTPNAHIAGVLDDPSLKTWNYYNRPVLLKVAGESVVWEELSEEEYDTYLDKFTGSTMSIPQIDLTDAPLWVDLTQGGLAELPERVPLTGGKAAAMAAFNDFPEIRIPSTPLAITIRGYVEHLESISYLLDVVLEDSDFLDSGQARFVVLEGEEDFLEEHAGDPDTEAWYQKFQADHPEESTLGSIVAAGGLKRLIRDQPLSEAFELALNETLSAHFSALSPLQGLRFRSSSTAEDIQGFNGAGLYDSNTGYLNPALQEEDKLQNRDVGWALKKTWASYWGFEAFEERRVAGIAHRSGSMGVLVHPRFDDEFEDANGVVTLYLAREASGPRLDMVVNAQAGEISVTNPDPSAPSTPEISRVLATGDAPPEVTYLQATSELAAGERVLSEEELMWLFGAITPLIQAWTDRVNEALPPPQQRSTLVLDFEFKRMKAGWPALASGEVLLPGLVLKQVRTLDSPIPALDEALLSDSVPRDILEEVVKVQRRTCQLGPLRLEVTDYWTDPAKAWALDFATQPFTSTMSLTVTEDHAELGLTLGDTTARDHLQAEFSHPEMSPGAPWGLLVRCDPSAPALGLIELEISDDGAWRLMTDGGTTIGSTGSCEVEELHEGPSAYLETLLAPPAREGG